MGAMSQGLLASLISQGFGLQIDWENPLAEGLVFAAFPGGPELISGVMPVKFGAGANVAVNEKGPAFATSNAATDGWYWPIAPSHPLYSITTADTLIVQMRRTSSQSFGNVFGVPYRSGAWAAPYYAWGMAVQSDTTQGSYSFATGSASRASSTSSSGLFTNNVGSRAQGYTRGGTAVRFYLGASQYGPDATIAAGSPDWSNKQYPFLFNRSLLAGEGAVAQGGPILVWNRELSPLEYRIATENPTILIRSPRTSALMMARSAAAPIADTAMTGTVLSQAAAAGTLSTAVRLASSSAVQVSSSGALSTAVSFIGATSVQVGGAGNLATSVRMAGTGAAQAAASGSLAGAGAALTGNALVTATAVGNISTSIVLAGASAARAGASGSLDAPGALFAGDSAVRMSAAGALSTAVVLSGAGVARASAVGVLAGAAAMLAGAAGTIASATGTLMTTINLSGLVAGRAVNAGAIMTWVRLAGTAAARMSASGNFGAGVIYARAPSGSGYTPQRNEYQVRPAQVGDTRPPVTEKNYR